jgi:prevent-host-death family protein
MAERPINIHDAKTNLSKLLERVENGEEIIIARAGKPIARLCPLPKRRRRRVLGKYAGQIQIADDFDELPDELAEALGARE